MDKLIKALTAMVNEALAHGFEPPYVLIARETNAALREIPANEEFGFDVESSRGTIYIRLIKSDQIMKHSAFDDPDALALITQHSYVEALRQLHVN